MNPHRQEQIDNYLLDRLSEAERIAFEKDMQEDPSLKEDVDLMRHIFIAFQRKSEREILHKQPAVSAAGGKYRKLITGSLSAAAAAVLLLLYLGFQPQYSSEQLFANYFIAEDFQISPSRGTGTEKERQNETLYSRTISCMTTEKPETTIDNLTYLSSQPDFEYREEALYALALAYLKDNRREEARKTLLLLMTENHSRYADEAIALSAKLKERKWFR